MVTSTGDWGDLLLRFPDREEAAVIKRFTGVSGSMGGANLGNSLKIFVCTEGLRIGVSRLFLPYIFVPWSEIQVERTKGLFPIAELILGKAEVGRLKIEGLFADRLARAAPPGLWPEPGTFPVMNATKAFWLSVMEWLLATTFLALVFSLLPRLVEGFKSPELPPLWVTILFPALIVGFLCMRRFAARRHN